jgi:hypothetical protein
LAICPYIGKSNLHKPHLNGTWKKYIQFLLLLIFFKYPVFMLMEVELPVWTLKSEICFALMPWSKLNISRCGRESRRENLICSFCKFICSFLKFYKSEGSKTISLHIPKYQIFCKAMNQLHIFIFFFSYQWTSTNRKKKRAEGSGYFYAERYVEIILVLSFWLFIFLISFDRLS